MIAVGKSPAKEKVKEKGRVRVAETFGGLGWDYARVLASAY